MGAGKILSVRNSVVDPYTPDFQNNISLKFVFFLSLGINDHLAYEFRDYCDDEEEEDDPDVKEDPIYAMDIGKTIGRYWCLLFNSRHIFWLKSSCFIGMDWKFGSSP